MNKRWLPCFICGILAVVAYISLTAVSYLHYPDAYSPLNNALSQLGDPLLNPSGAVFYDAGGILMGLLLIPFYLGMTAWNTGDHRQKILTAGGQIAGILSSLALISSCVFPAGTHTPVHVMSAGLAFLTSLFFWVFSAFSMLRNPASVRWIPYFGYLPLISNIILAFIPAGRFLTEWVSVFMFIVYVVLLACNSRVMNLAKTHPS